jgi:hypothetical protein
MHISFINVAVRDVIVRFFPVGLVYEIIWLCVNQKSLHGR